MVINCRPGDRGPFAWYDPRLSKHEVYEAAIIEALRQLEVEDDPAQAIRTLRLALR